MPDTSGDLNVLSEDPLCAAVYLPNLDVPVIPNERHFIRSHFTAPQIETSTWSLPVVGEVTKPLDLSYNDLISMPSHEVINVMECAGNSRSTMQPPAEGVQWDNGAVSTSAWRGVPVKTVLEQAGLTPAATDVLFEGTDSGTEPHSGRKLIYAMSIPIEKLLNTDTLLAYEMNGETLPKDHGFPVRLVVPGWYGMASVKWLAKIAVMDHPNGGFHEMDYRIFPATDGEHDAVVERVTSLKVKSLISTPAKGNILQPGAHTIKGVAWSGDGHITKVEVSTDDDRSWREAVLEAPSGTYSWQHWEIDWQANNIGHSLIRSRATDSVGNVQPMLATWNFRGYQVNSIHSVPVTIRRP